MHNRFIQISDFLIVIIVSMMITGCAQPLQMVQAESLGLRHEYNKNYTLNKSQKVSVGEAVIKVADYYSEKKKIPKVTPVQNFSAGVCGHPSMNYMVGNKYNVVGTLNHNGESFNVVRATNWSVLVDKHGVVRYAAVEVSGQWGVGLCSVEVAPVTAKFEQLSEDAVSIEKGYNNYEFLYNGIDKNSITFTYREFSPEGYARVAFYQTLTYDSNAKVIKFRKFKIEVSEANSEGITYTVVEEN